MKKIKVGLANRVNVGVVLELEDRGYNGHTPKHVFQEDAERALEVLRQLPSGTLNCIVRRLLHDEVMEYLDRGQKGEKYGYDMAEKFQAVHAAYAERTA